MFILENGNIKLKLEQHCFDNIKDIKKINIDKKDYILLLSPSCLSILDYDSNLNKFFVIEKYLFEKKDLRDSLGENICICPSQKYIVISAFQENIRFFELTKLKLKELMNYQTNGVIWDIRLFYDQDKVYFGLLSSR